MARPPLLAAAAATERRPAAGAVTAEDRRDERDASAGEEAAAAGAATTTREEEALTEATGAARTEVERAAAQPLEAVARAAIAIWGKEGELRAGREERRGRKKGAWKASDL